MGLVVTEGGPTLLRELLAEGLVDDLVLTLAPLLVAGTGARSLHGAGARPAGATWRCATSLRSGDHLFLHYAARGVSASPPASPACAPGTRRSTSSPAGRS